MNGNSAALDTNWAISVLNNDPVRLAWVRTLSRVYLPLPVVAELRFGALNSGRVDHNQRRVDAMIGLSVVLDATLPTADTCARLRLALRSAGRPIPQNDLWIAALCVQHGVALATDDAHFAVVPGLVLAHP